MYKKYLYVFYFNIVQPSLFIIGECGCVSIYAHFRGRVVLYFMLMKITPNYYVWMIAYVNWPNIFYFIVFLFHLTDYFFLMNYVLNVGNKHTSFLFRFSARAGNLNVIYTMVILWVSLQRMKCSALQLLLYREPLIFSWHTWNLHCMQWQSETYSIFNTCKVARQVALQTQVDTSAYDKNVCRNKIQEH